MGAPLISVVIPVYNAEKYIGECLDSVIGSAFSALEILCVDDGSDDRSREIIWEYEKADPRVRLIEQGHRYAGTARNNGLEHASGEYVHFLDADDLIEPGAYEELYGVTKEYEAEVYEFLYKNVNAQTGETISEPDYSPNAAVGKPEFVSLKEDPEKLILSAKVIPWNKLYRREFLKNQDIRFDDLICAEDRSFYYALIRKAERILRIQSRLVIHRQNIATSLEGSDMRLRCFYVEFRSFENIWNDYKAEPEMIKRMILEAGIRDSVYYFMRALGTEYEQSVRKQMFEYWRPYFPLLDDSIFFKPWFGTFLTVISDGLPREYGDRVTGLYRAYKQELRQVRKNCREELRQVRQSSRKELKRFRKWDWLVKGAERICACVPRPVRRLGRKMLNRRSGT